MMEDKIIMPRHEVMIDEVRGEKVLLECCKCVLPMCCKKSRAVACVVLLAVVVVVLLFLVSLSFVIDSQL